MSAALFADLDHNSIIPPAACRIISASSDVVVASDRTGSN
jgi:hypothetical protein